MFSNLLVLSSLLYLIDKRSIIRRNDTFIVKNIPLKLSPINSPIWVLFSDFIFELSSLMSKKIAFQYNSWEEVKHLFAKEDIESLLAKPKWSYFCNFLAENKRLK